MAKFLDTTGVSYHLEQIIKNAKGRLTIISPFLKINDRIKSLLEDQNRLKIDIRIVYGKIELQPDENDWLKALDFIRLSFCKNLHAKCYMNEQEALVTSMNLYEFSQSNNNEMGILVKKEEDETLYEDIENECQRLIRNSEEIKISVEKIPKKSKNSSKEKIKKRGGFCIRCEKDIKLNPEVPYCKECYKIWKEYGDKEYQEEHCHICGKSNKSSLLKPSCYSCYKKYKDDLNFPLEV